MPIFIGITGSSGSGKTYFSEALAKAISAQGITCVVVNSDHYYYHTPNLSAEERDKVNFCHPDAIDFKLLENNILDLGQGKPIDRPCYNFTTCAREKSTFRIEPAQVVIIEGLLVFNSQIIRDVCAIKVFMDVELDLCLSRRLLRDKNERNLDYKYILTTYETLIRPSFFNHTKPFKLNANLMIENEEEVKSALLCLPKWLTMELESKKETQASATMLISKL